MSLSAFDVSVVTVNWNGKEHLKALLPSLTALQVGEIILIDNGSTDGSQEFVRAHYPEVRIIQNSSNLGFAQPHNAAAEIARGRCLALINNDMRCHPDWINAALARMEGSTVCVGSRILDWEGQKIDFNGSSLQYLGYALQRDLGKPWTSVGHPDRILFPCGGAMLIDREVFREVGGFDEDYFAIYEDVDLGWRLWLAGYEVAYAPDSLAFHRGHSTFKSQAGEKMRYLMHRNALLTVFKNYEEANFRRIFPLAVILAIKRAVLFSGVERDRFYLWSKSRERLQRGDPTAPFQILDALNHLVAVDDVLDNLPNLLQRRSRVQAMRKRSDAEIFGLFIDPFREIVEDPEYRRIERTHLEMQELTKMFEPLTCPPAPAKRTSELQDEIARLRREIKALQWQGVQFALHPDTGVKPGARKFIQTWRDEGFRVAWRRFLEYVERGL